MVEMLIGMIEKLPEDQKEAVRAYIRGYIAGLEEGNKGISKAYICGYTAGKLEEKA